MNTPLHPPKVVFILPAFYRNGAVNLIVNLAQHLTEHAIEPKILAVRDCQQRSSLPKSSVATEVVLKEHQSTLSGLAQLLFRLVRSIVQADVVIYTWENGILIPSMIAFILRKPAIAIVQNNFQKNSEGNSNYGRERLIRRWVYGRCKAIVCVGSGLKATIEPGIDRARVTSVQNGVDIEKVRRLAKEPYPTQITAVGKSDLPYIVGVGRLSYLRSCTILDKPHQAVI